MPEIDLMRVDQCVSDVKLDVEPPGFFDGGVTVDVEEEEDEDSDCLKKSVARSVRRGRPPRTLGKASSPTVSRKRREDEDVCFVCFDGGSLVLCDRRLVCVFELREVTLQLNFYLVRFVLSLIRNF